jgi:cell division protein FtsX
VKPANFSTLLDDVRDAVVTVFRACAGAARGIAELPWPALLCAALLLAIAMTIIPLALMLFVTFLVIKFAVAAIVVGKQRRRSD